ncbi:MAG: alcohol dehydrogenase catalytic domain-containing protein [Spirochaetota bacterium]|nr:alcohol dehydrogenase catalytic domain-containing protein [Spirochaetota bacterium]
MKALFFENNIFRIIMTNIAIKFNKNAALGRLSPISYKSVSDPEIPNQRWLKVRNKICGLCGSDIHFIYMEVDPKCFPAAIPGISRKYLGHELLSEVVDVGSDVEGINIGDRVVLRIDWPSCFQMEFDPPCMQCADGNYMLCENLGKIEPPVIDTGCGFSEYMIMHRSQPHKVPDEISDDEAVLIEPAACAVHGVLRDRPKKGDRILVIGCGTIGLMTIAVAKAIEPESRVYALAKYPFQVDAAMKIGADDVLMGSKDLFRDVAKRTDAQYIRGFFGNEILLGGYDIIYDTIGNDRSINNALRLSKAGGHVIILGINLKPGKIDYTPIWYQEVQLSGINSHANEYDSETSFDIATRLIAEKKINMEGLITHRYRLDDFKEAVNTFLDKSRSEAIKIVIDHEM